MIIGPPVAPAQSSDGALLDATQYQTESIEKYEAVYGRNFVSPGGLDSARACIARLGLQPGMQVLDVGCGLGGSAFCMAREYGAQVHAIDVSANMLALARQRMASEPLNERLTFEQCDVLGPEMSRHAGRYQAIYSRDVFLHIHDKARLFERLFELLAPGGLLFFTDYCRGEDAPSPAFAAYIKERQYDLCSVRQYQGLLDGAGFVGATATDRTDEFVAILQTELSRITDDAAHAAIHGSWRDKIGRARRGEQGWCWGEGRRP